MGYTGALKETPATMHHYYLLVTSAALFFLTVLGIVAWVVGRSSAEE